MIQRDIFYKWLFYALLGLAWMTVQQAILNSLTFWGGVHPFVLPLVPVMVAILEKRHESAFFALIAGLICDLLMPAVIPCFYALTFLLAALLSGLIAGRAIMPSYLCAFVCAVPSITLINLLQGLFLLPASAISTSDILWLSGRELLLTLPFTPLFFLTFRKIRRLAHNE